MFANANTSIGSAGAPGANGRASRSIRNERDNDNTPKGGEKVRDDAMASIVKKADRTEARNIALAKAEREGGSRLRTLRDTLKGLEVGDAITLDDADLKLWNEALPNIVKNIKNGTKLTKEQRKPLTGISGGIARELNAALYGDPYAGKAKVLGGFVNDNGTTRYEVVRTK